MCLHDQEKRRRRVGEVTENRQEAMDSILYVERDELLLRSLLIILTYL
ncbi:unnamed protein product [Brassica napus]|uniref:(rape) hypothetical protein n=1 Tax=Brassica napus TaxID=3708 RepID=A0A816LLM5_BRANA|nr:unnamed protein product [Brassica napus]